MGDDGHRAGASTTRRRVLVAVGVGGLSGTSGCLGLFGTDDPEPSSVTSTYEYGGSPSATAGQSADAGGDAGSDGATTDQETAPGGSPGAATATRDPSGTTTDTEASTPPPTQTSNRSPVDDYGHQGYGQYGYGG